MSLSRRNLLQTSAAVGGILVLPRVSIAQADNRPSISIAVQQISNSASLEPLREQSNVGERIFASIYDRLINRNYQGKLEPIPGLAESWRRIDDRTVELDLRKGVKFHNGDEMTAEDVVYSFGAERMFGEGYDAKSNKTLFADVRVRDTVKGKELPPEVPAVA